MNKVIHFSIIIIKYIDEKKNKLFLQNREKLKNPSFIDNKNISEYKRIDNSEYNIEIDRY